MRIEIADITTDIATFNITDSFSTKCNEKYEIFDWELPFKYNESKIKTELWSVLKEYHMPILFISENGNLLFLLEEGENNEDKWLLIKSPMTITVELLEGRISIQDLLSRPSTDIYLVIWDISKDHLDILEKISAERLRELTTGIDLTVKLRKNNKIEKVLKYFTNHTHIKPPASNLRYSVRTNFPIHTTNTFSPLHTPTKYNGNTGGMAA